MGKVARIIKISMVAAVLAGALWYAVRLYKKPPPNVVFILIDTLRPDHLGCYGYKLPTSPNIDRLANESYRFSDAYSVSNWTKTTVATLFTGKHPMAILPAALLDEAITLALPSELDTVAELLTNAGRKTIALIDHPIIPEYSLYNQGFQTFHSFSAKNQKLPIIHDPTQNAPDEIPFSGTRKEHILAKMDEVLEETGEQPFFLYMHLIYPHQPYSAPRSYQKIFGPHHLKVLKENKATVVHSYNAEIRYTDDLIGEVYQLLEKKGLLKNSYVILTSDHGESFWEHDLFGHGNSFYEQEIRIPLIVRPPEGLSKSRVIQTPVSNIDLFPSVLNFSKLPVPDDAEGRSLSRFFSGDETKPGQPLFSEGSCYLDKDARAVISEKMKYVFSPDAKNQEKIPDANERLLIDLKKDPEEMRNAVNEHPETAAGLSKILDQHTRSTSEKRKAVSKVTHAPDEKILEELKSLGY